MLRLVADASSALNSNHVYMVIYGGNSSARHENSRYRVHRFITVGPITSIYNDRSDL